MSSARASATAAGSLAGMETWWIMLSPRGVNAEAGSLTAVPAPQ